MNEKESQLELMHRYLSGDATQEEAQALEALILQDASVRREFLRYAHLDAALAGNHRPAVFGGPSRSARNIVTETLNWLSWRPLTAAAAGIVFGIFCASVAWAIASPQVAATASLFRSLVDGSFENVSGRVPSGFPGKGGEWSGDEAAAASFGALKPKVGQRMLQFLKAEGDPAARGSRSAFCDVFQVVDLKSLRTELDKSGDTVLELSTEFLDARQSSGAPVQFFCSIYIFEGDAAAMRSQWPWALSYAIGRGTDSLITEGGTGDAHWQKATARCLWTAQADFAVIHIAAGHAPNTSGPPVQFGRLFADDVKLTIKSQPMLPVRIVQR